MRFFVPSNELAGDVDPVEAFQQRVMDKASVINVSGDAIAIFREIHCLTPRYVTKIQKYNCLLSKIAKSISVLMFGVNLKCFFLFQWPL